MPQPCTANALVVAGPPYPWRITAGGWHPRGHMHHVLTCWWAACQCGWLAVLAIPPPSSEMGVPAAGDWVSCSECNDGMLSLSLGGLILALICSVAAPPRIPVLQLCAFVPQRAAGSFEKASKHLEGGFSRSRPTIIVQISKCTRPTPLEAHINRHQPHCTNIYASCTYYCPAILVPAWGYSAATLSPQ